MIHKWLEEWHDTLLFIGIMIGLLGFFLSYWKEEYQIRYAEIVLQDFLSVVTVDGKITLEEYEGLIRNLDKINSKFEVNINCVEYFQKPVYSLIPENELVQYYMSRNVKKEVNFPNFEPFIEEETPDSLRLQKESNSTIIGANQLNGLPLPNEEATWNVEALRPTQKVYEGEELITICHITSADGEYYAEAEPTTAADSGITFLLFPMGDEIFQVPVQVICYPRIVICENGHEVVNVESVLTESRIISKEDCPYCGILPQYIVCSAEIVQKETGIELKEEDIWINVVYMNGDTELVTPESKEWKDSYDKNYCGIQRVTVWYRGKEDAFLVVSENKGCQQCKKACNDRCYEDYINFPYCTECMSEVPLFTGNVYEEECRTTTRELVAYLDEKKEKFLKAGDFVQLYLSTGDKYITLLQERVKKDGKNR